MKNLFEEGGRKESSTLMVSSEARCMINNSNPNSEGKDMNKKESH